MTYINASRNLILLMLLLSSFGLQAQVDYQVKTGYFLERKTYDPTNELSASRFFWDYDEYLFLNFKATDQKNRALIIEIPFDIGMRPRQWYAAVRLPFGEYFNAGITVRHTENVVETDKQAELLDIYQHYSEPPDWGFEKRYDRAGYALGADIGYYRSVGKLSLEQDAGFGVGFLERYNFYWYDLDPNSNLIFLDDYNFEKSPMYFLQGRTALFFRLFQMTKLGVEIGYEANYRLDFAKEKVTLTQHLWTRDNYEVLKEDGFLNTKVFRHYVSLRMTYRTAK